LLAGAREGAGSFGLAENPSGPVPVEGILAPIVQERRDGKKGRQRRQKNGPGFFAHQPGRDEVEIARQLAATAGFAAHAPHAVAQSRKKLVLVARPWDFRVSHSDRGQGMSVAAADSDLSPVPGQKGGMQICRFQHLRVERLDRRKIFPEPLKIFLLARAGQARKDVIDAEKQPFFRKVYQQGDQIIAPLLNLDMLALGQIVDTDMDFRAARHLAGDFFADEKVFVSPQRLGAFDRIVLGQSDQVHPALFQSGVDFARIAVTFATEFAHERSGA
jgi:hypothetical protein